MHLRIMLATATLLFCVLGFFAVGCGGSGGDANEEPVLVGSDAEGRELYDTDGDGKADIACGGRGGDVIVTANGGNASNSGNGGDGGGCVSIVEGDDNDGGNAGDDQDNSSEETTEVPA